MVIAASPHIAASDGAATGIPRGTVLEEIPVDQVDVDANVRSSDELGDLDELAASIRIHGVLQPIRVMRLGTGRYRLIHGQRRLLAVTKAGLERIPALVDEVSHGNAEDIAVEQLVENLQRRDLAPLDEARALKRVLAAEPSLTQASLAERIGRSAPWVANSLRLLDLATPVQGLIREGRLSAAHGKVIAGLDAAVQADVAKAAVDRGLSSKELEREAQWIAQRTVNVAENDERERKRERDLLARAKAGLEKRHVAKATRIVVYAYRGGALATGLRKAGFTKVSTSSSWVQPRPKAAFCDCTAWAIDTHGGSAVLKPLCVVDAHRQAESEAETKARRDDEATRVAATTSVQAWLVNELAAHPLPRMLARLLFVEAIGNWQIETWAKGRPGAGDGKKPDAWGAVAALSDEDLARELTERLADGLRHWGQVVVRIAEDLGLKEED